MFSLFLDPTSNLLFFHSSYSKIQPCNSHYFYTLRGNITRYVKGLFFMLHATLYRGIIQEWHKVNAVPIAQLKDSFLGLLWGSSWPQLRNIWLFTSRIWSYFVSFLDDLTVGKLYSFWKERFLNEIFKEGILEKNENTLTHTIFLHQIW